MVKSDTEILTEEKYIPEPGSPYKETMDRTLWKENELHVLFVIGKSTFLLHISGISLTLVSGAQLRTNFCMQTESVSHWVSWKKLLLKLLTKHASHPFLFFTLTVCPPSMFIANPFRHVSVSVRPHFWISPRTAKALLSQSWKNKEYVLTVCISWTYDFPSKLVILLK